MKHIHGRRSLVVMALALISVVAMVAWRGEPQSEEFHGWIIYKDGQVHKYQIREWSIDPKADSCILKKANSGDFVTYYGTFRVFELRRAVPPSPGGEPVPFSWEVTQEGVRHLYTKDDGWDIMIHDRGIQLDKQKIRIWYYGNFQFHYRDR